MNTGLPLMKSVLAPLFKSVLLPLGLTTAALATHAAIQKKKNSWIWNYNINNFK